MLRSIRWLAWLMVAYLLAAATYELVLALRHSMSPDREAWILLGALVAMLVGIVLVFFRVGSAALIAPAAALFVVARLHTGDPYYAPYFHAYGDGGLFSAVWGFGLLGLALVAGATTWRWRRTVPVESVALLLLLAWTALWMGAGH
jgi:hypothetical protein